jgi:hypothetical protein
MVVVLVGNETDLQNRQISREQAEKRATELKAIYRETSTVTGKGITEVFEDACEEYLKLNRTVIGTVRKNKREMDKKRAAVDSSLCTRNFPVRSL